jgi:hypothetical protein
MKIALLKIRFLFHPAGHTGIAYAWEWTEPGLFVIGNDAGKTIDKIAAYRPDAVAFSVISGSHQGCTRLPSV